MTRTPNDRLRQLRRDAGMTQREVADHVGASHQAVSHWEQGTRPRPPSLVALADLFGVPVAAIDPERQTPQAPQDLDDPPAYRAGIGHTWRAIPDDAWRVICDHARRRHGTPTELLRAFAAGLDRGRRTTTAARPSVRNLMQTRSPHPVKAWESEP